MRRDCAWQNNASRKLAYDSRRTSSESSAHLAHYDVCEQDSCDDENSNTHAMSLVPTPMYPLPISNTFCYAVIQWNQEKKRCHRRKNPDHTSCEEDSEIRRVPMKPGLNTKQ